MNYCGSCGVPIPDGQGYCSMCVGDINYGRDGYYEQWAREREREREADEADASEMGEA
jgi:predicted nucleic acid-binding Zn ribbon protein